MDGRPLEEYGALEYTGDRELPMIREGDYSGGTI